MVQVFISHPRWLVCCSFSRDLPSQLVTDVCLDCTFTRVHHRNSTDTSLSWKPWVSVYHSPNGSDIGTLVAAAVAAAGIGGSIVIPLNRTAMFSGCMGSATVYNSDLVPMDVVTGSVYPCPLRQWAHNAAVRILPDAKRILMNGGMGPVQVSVLGSHCR